MTRFRRADRPRASRQAGTPSSGFLPSGVPFAAIVSALGLAVVAFVSLSLMGGNLPFVGGTTGNNGGNTPGKTDDPKILKTPTPSSVVVVPSVEPGITVPGTLIYVKAGNIWAQANGEAKQITSGGDDSQATFSADGKSIYFVRTRRANGRWRYDDGGCQPNAPIRSYRMDVPSIMRIPAAGGAPTKILDGLIDPSGSMKWMGIIQGPAVSPDGTTLALASDMPDPCNGDVTLKLLTIKGRRLTDPKLSQVPPLGHQDPAWKPNGSVVAFVRNDRDGAKGTPRILTYNPDTKRTRTITGPGYLHPAWSPSGRFIAATKTSAYGTDVVVIDANTGAEILNVTGDGDSWGPVWSPAGDQIAYLHVSGQVVDLRLAQLEGTAPSWTVKETLDLTTNAGLDSVSRPSWFVPADQMPASTEAPASDPPEPSASDAASTSPDASAAP
jgi:Tol biopolymer transport system component